MRARCQALLWPPPFIFPFTYPQARRKSRLNCGNDETKLRTIQFSFFLNGVTVIQNSTEQMCAPPGGRQDRPAT
jgi:hypothetical protein